MSYTSSLQLLLLELGRHQVLPLWLDLQPVDIESRWRHNWKSAQVVNSHLQAGNRVSTSLGNSGLCWTVFVQNGHCGACRRKWRLTDTDLCPCGETQTMSHIVESCPDKTECRLISATLCGWRRCFVADQLWLMKCIREEEGTAVFNDWLFMGCQRHRYWVWYQYFHQTTYILYLRRVNKGWRHV